MVHDAVKVLDRDRKGNPLERKPINGPHVKGSVCFTPRNDPEDYFRSHGDLEVEDLVIGFSTRLDSTNDWAQTQTVLESLRFEKK